MASRSTARNATDGRPDSWSTDLSVSPQRSHFDADRAHHPNLAQQLRTRTLIIGTLTGALLFAALIPIARDAPTLTPRASPARQHPLLVLSALAGTATLVLLQRRYNPARFTATAAVASVVLGWGVGQYPWLLVDQVTITDAAGAPATLRALLVAVTLAAIIVLPALAYLFRITQTEAWTRH